MQLSAGLHQQRWKQTLFIGLQIETEQKDEGQAISALQKSV